MLNLKSQIHSIAMKRISLLCIALLFVSLFTAADWLQFRGSDQTSLAEGSKLPTQYDAGKNLAWKAPLLGRGTSGPIVVGDRVLLTASSGAVVQDDLHVLAFDA